MNQGSNSNQKINPQGAAVPEEEKLEFLKREEIRTMQKDVIRLREGEAQTERERITELKPQEPRKEIPVRLPAKQEKREIDLVKNREWETQSLCIIKGLRKEGAEKFFKGIGNLREAFRSRLSKFWS